ncbi:MAG: response regulator transcription factor [Anaerolineae bacterium]|nr:response regulator transcription factor [Anaerolineae bacterium]
MRVLLADDQAQVRSALWLLLEQEPGFQLVGEAADATGLLLAAAEKAPDLVLLDWELPGLPVAQLVRLLQYERPLLKIIAMSSRPEVAQLALKAGVHAFLSKSESPERVLSIIRANV